MASCFLQLLWNRRRRDSDVDPRALAQLGLDADRASRFPDDRPADRQPETTPVRPGRRKWFEDTREVLWGDTGSAVGDDDHHTLVEISGRDGQLAAPAGRLAGVREQIQQHLFKLTLSAGDSRQILGDLD